MKSDREQAMERYPDEFEEPDEGAIFDEPEDKPFCCSRCGCIIGEEVGYSDDFGDGPICDLCLPK